MVSCFIFFKFNVFALLLVDIVDLVHDVEAIFSLTANSIWKSFLKYE